MLGPKQLHALKNIIFIFVFILFITTSDGQVNVSAFQTLNSALLISAFLVLVAAEFELAPWLCSSVRPSALAPSATTPTLPGQLLPVLTWKPDSPGS